MNSITYFEDLSNEILCQIFESLNIFDLFRSFSNLNRRFTDLTYHRSLSFKLTLGLKVNFDKQILSQNQHRISSLHLKDRFSKILLNLSFQNLQILNLDGIRQKKFLVLFPSLKSLSYLRSLTIYFHDLMINLTEIYSLLFQLSHLIKLKISARNNILTLQLPINTSEQSSHLQYLFINHSCSLNELLTLLSYTPCLTHLSCKEISKTVHDIPIKSIHLTKISFAMFKASFDRLEMFINMFGKQIRVFYINASDDEAYLDANRWERFILQSMPHLTQLKFEYHEWHYQNVQLTSNHHLLKRFTSPFWIDRGWVFKITTELDYWPPVKAIYSISSDRYDQWKFMTKKSRTLCMLRAQSDISLTINSLYYATDRESIVDEYFSFLNRFFITDLNIDCRKLIYTKFIRLLLLLPNLNSLRIYSVSSLQCVTLSSEDIKIVQTNQITNLCIQSFMNEADFEKIQRFIDLCHHVTYLEIKCEQILNIESLVRYILKILIYKTVYLTLLCLRIPFASNDLIERLKSMIDREKLIFNYHFSCTTDRIYLHLT